MARERSMGNSRFESAELLLLGRVPQVAPVLDGVLRVSGDVPRGPREEDAAGMCLDDAERSRPET